MHANKCLRIYLIFQHTNTWCNDVYNYQNFTTKCEIKKRHSSVEMLIPDKNSIINSIFDKCITPQVQITRSNWLRRQPAAHAACRDPKWISVQRYVCPAIVSVGMAVCIRDPQGIRLFDRKRQQKFSSTCICSWTAVCHAAQRIPKYVETSGLAPRIEAENSRRPVKLSSHSRFKLFVAMRHDETTSSILVM